MNQDQQQTDNDTISPWARHRFIIMISGTIFLALMMVFIAMTIYSSSGASQLDLSLPRYQSLRTKSNTEEKIESYSSTGILDKQALDDFKEAYDKQANQIIGIDSFGGEVMSNESLNINPSVDSVE